MTNEHKIMVSLKGKKYPVREFLVKEIDDDTEKTIIVAHDSLSNAIQDILGDDFDYSKDPTNSCWEIDQKIYFYLPDNEFNLSAEEICKSCLDIEFEFIKEEQY